MAKLWKMRNMHTDDDFGAYYDAIDWYDGLKKVHGSTDVSAAVIEKLRKSENPLERRALMQALSWEHRRNGRYQEAEKVLEAEAALDPSDAMPLINLAELALYHRNDPAAALSLVNRAVTVANLSGHFRRHALGVKARIALAMDDYTLLADCLVEIAAVELLRGQRDVGKEHDFFDRADKKRLPPHSATAFQQFLAS
jgi:hypothetical protein